MGRVAATTALAACLTACSGARSPPPVATLKAASSAGRISSERPAPHVRTTPIRIGGTPWGIAYGFEAVWVPIGDEVVEINVRTDDVESRVRIDPSIASGVTTRGDPATYDTAAIGATGVWVTVPRERRLTVVHIDPKYQRVIAPIAVGPGPGVPVPVVVGPDGVWLPSPADDELVRIDPRTDSVVDRVPLPHGVDPVGMALAGGAVWISDRASDALLRVDPGSGRVVDRLDVRGSGQLWTDGARVWVASQRGGEVVAVDASKATIAGRTPLCDGGANVALGPALVWTSGVDEVCLVEPQRSTPMAPIELPGVGPVAAYDRSAWVAVPSRGTVVRLDTA